MGVAPVLAGSIGRVGEADAGGGMKHERVVILQGPVPIGIVPVFRVDLADYNQAAWEIEGRYLYPEWKSYEEYRRAYEAEHAE